MLFNFEFNVTVFDVPVFDITFLYPFGWSITFFKVIVLLDWGPKIQTDDPKISNLFNETFFGSVKKAGFHLFTHWPHVVVKGNMSPTFSNFCFYYSKHITVIVFPSVSILILCKMSLRNISMLFI